MPVDKHDALSDNFVGRGHRLLRIASVVGQDHFELLTEHAALGVDIGDRHLGAALHLFSDNGIRAGDRADHCNRNVLCVGDCAGQHKSRRQDDGSDEALHETS